MIPFIIPLEESYKRIKNVYYIKISFTNEILNCFLYSPENFSPQELYRIRWIGYIKKINPKRQFTEHYIDLDHEYFPGITSGVYSKYKSIIINHLRDEKLNILL
jgi:hypothetical protein